MSSRYDELTARVDAFHVRVDVAHPGALTCRAGCSMCCHQHLSVLTYEFRRIAAAVGRLPAATLDALAERATAGREDPRCVLLGEDDHCLVYDARPMICRSHGVPVQVGDPSERDVCPLNFVDGPEIGDLDDELVLDVERLNVLLALIDRFDGGGDGASRVDLIEGLAALLGMSQQAHPSDVRSGSR